ncbi:MAG: ABC transporter permease [Gemmatimonadaceae bacterium]|nr:ABC transporter permease [Gemmatimonadaceae bacterium]
MSSRAPRWTKVRRDATAHWPRTLLVALAMAVALAGSGVVLVAWALVRRATQEGFEASNPAAATLHGSGFSDAVLAAARAVPNVREVERRRVSQLAVQIAGQGQNAILFTADDPTRVQIGTLRSVDGQWAPPPGSVAVERSSMDFARAVVGDTALLMRGGEGVALPLASSVRDVGLAPGWMEHVVYLWGSTATLTALGLPADANELRFTVDRSVRSREAVRAVAAAVQRAVESAGGTVSNVDVPEPGEHIHAPQMDSLLFTQGGFGLLALLTAAFLMVNLVNATMAGQLREIGVMKSFGADDRQLRRMYLAGAAVQGVVVTLVALAPSLWLGRRYAEFRAELLNFDVSAVAVPWWTVALLIAVGVSLPVLAAWFPVRRGTRVTVAEALRDLGLHDDQGDATESWLARRGGWSRVFALSVRNAFRRRQRLVLTMLTLATGGAVYIGAGNLRQAVIGSLDLIYGSQRFTFTVRLESPQDAARVERIVRAVEGVRGAESWSGVRASLVQGGVRGEPFPITATPIGSAMLAPTLAAGSVVTEGGQTLLVNRAMRMAIPGLAPGAELELEILGRRSRWRVVGVFEGGPTPQAYTSVEAIATVRGDARRGAVVVVTDMTGDGSIADLIQRVRAALTAEGIGVASSGLLAESRRVTEDHLLMVVQFLSLMSWVMIVVGGMGLASTMGLAVLERTREIAVMRAIGASHRTVFTLFQSEGLTIALLGWVIAIPLSLPFSVVLGEAFSRIMFRVPLRLLPDAESVWRWLVVVVVVSVVACAWPAVRAVRLTIARALAYE